MSKKKAKPSRKARRRQNQQAAARKPVKSLTQQAAKNESSDQDEHTKIEEITAPEDGWKDFALDESLFICPNCQSIEISSMNGSLMKCQSCKHEFQADFYPNEPDKTAIALYLKARKELEQKEFESQDETDTDIKAISLLLSGIITKLESLIKQEQARVGSRKKLAEMCELYASLLLKKSSPFYQQAKYYALKGLDYAKQSETQEQFYLSKELEGKLYQHLANALEGQNALDQALKEYKKAIDLFEELYKKAKESGDKTQQAKYSLALIRNLWRLAFNYLEKDKPGQARFQFKRLMEVLTQAYTLFPDRKLEIDGGFCAIYSHLYGMSLRGDDLQTRARAESYRQAMEDYQERCQNGAGLGAFLVWIDVLSKEEGESYGRDLDVMQSSTESLNTLQSQSMELDWAHLDEKSRAHHLREVQRLQSEFIQSYLKRAGSQQAQELVLESVKSLEEVADTYSEDPESLSIAIQSVPMAEQFKDYGYLFQAQNMFELSARMIETFLMDHRKEVNIFEKHQLARAWSHLLESGFDPMILELEKDEIANRLETLLVSLNESHQIESPQIYQRALEALEKYYRSLGQLEKAEEIRERMTQVFDY